VYPLRILFVVLLAVITTSAFAETVHDDRTWFNLTAQGRVRESHWFWYFDVQERNRNESRDADQFVARPGIGYSLTANSTVLAGYAYTANFQSNGGILNENRIWEQYQWTVRAGRGTLSARTRVEERFFEDTQMAWRVREQVRFLRPLESKQWLAPLVWDEIMAHVNSTSRAQRGFDQNRAFSGVEIGANRKAHIDVGYMNQFSRSSTVYRMNHILSTVVSLSF
jgi:hypothetical protein